MLCITTDIGPFLIVMLLSYVFTINCHVFWYIWMTAYIGGITVRCIFLFSGKYTYNSVGEVSKRQFTVEGIEF